MGEPGPSVLQDVFRRWGYLAADLDPLGRLASFRHPDLDEALRRGGDSKEAARLESIYCGSIGADFMRLPFEDRCRFIAGKMGRAPPPVDRRRLLRRLGRSGLFGR